MGIKVYGGNATLGANSFTGVQLLPGGAVGAPSLALSATPTTGVWWRNSNAFNLSFQGTMRYEFGAGGDLNIGGGSLVGLLMNGVNAQTVNDTGVCRVSSGVVEVNNGSAAGFAVIRTYRRTGSQNLFSQSLCDGAFWKGAVEPNHSKSE